MELNSYEAMGRKTRRIKQKLKSYQGVLPWSEYAVAYFRSKRTNRDTYIEHLVGEVNALLKMIHETRSTR